MQEVTRSGVLRAHALGPPDTLSSGRPGRAWPVRPLKRVGSDGQRPRADPGRARGAGGGRWPRAVAGSHSSCSGDRPVCGFAAAQRARPGVLSRLRSASVRAAERHGGDGGDGSSRVLDGDVLKDGQEGRARGLPARSGAAVSCRCPAERVPDNVPRRLGVSPLPRLTSRRGFRPEPFASPGSGSVSLCPPAGAALGVSAHVGGRPVQRVGHGRCQHESPEEERGLRRGARRPRSCP